MYFTTTASFGGGDADSTADLYQVAVDGSGATTISLLSVGNGAGCDPAANSNGNNWNAVGGASPDGCGVVPIAGGAGVAADTGTVYFLSPEDLDGEGTENQPNLYVVRPGEAPEFVATLELEHPAVVHAVADNEIHRWADFQVTDNGAFSALATSEPVDPEYDNDGFQMVYRYRTADDSLVCPVTAWASPPADGCSSTPAISWSCATRTASWTPTSSKKIRVTTKRTASR